MSWAAKSRVAVVSADRLVSALEEIARDNVLCFPKHDGIVFRHRIINKKLPAEHPDRLRIVSLSKDIALRLSDSIETVNRFYENPYVRDFVQESSYLGYSAVLSTGGGAPLLSISDRRTYLVDSHPAHVALQGREIAQFEMSFSEEVDQPIELRNTFDTTAPAIFLRGSDA